jgi:phosphate transport system substrate-binding protein
VLTDQPGDRRVADHRGLVHPPAREAGEARGGREVLKFFDWSFKNGAKMAAELDYVPMPEPVVKQIEARGRT